MVDQPKEGGLRVVTGEAGDGEPKRTDQHDSSAASLQEDASQEEPMQEPIRVKRTPRLRSGKYEELDTSD